jgi:DMSO/TMAO reductase YedYZ molybdopterin-dependent catalytic subunit
VASHRPFRWAALAGVLAVAAALGVGELAAGILPGVPSPILAVSRLIVDLQPAGAKDLFVFLFGTADKLALEVIIVVVALAVGVGVGRLAVGRPGWASVIIGGFVGFGFVAALRDPAVQPALAVSAAAVQAVLGIELLRRLVAVAMAPARAASAGDAPPSDGGMPDWRRRAFLRWSSVIAIGSLGAVAIGRTMLARQAAPPPADETFPEPVEPARLPDGADIATADLQAAGLAPIVVPNERFYRIDTAFVTPSVERDLWQLKVTGLVDREIELSWDELVQLPIIEQHVTIACVSNEIGGGLVGNAAWTGVPLRTVLDMAGVRPEADQLVGLSYDSFSAGMPVAWVMDESRVPMIAIGMNGEPLPREHGYPARLIVPGLYGYVSATKWLTELRLTTFRDYQAFWIVRGWADRAPILTQSRIDVPRGGASLTAGRVAVAGVAWAPDRGVERVEVRVDEGAWQAARMSTPISDATWVQWVYEWDATPGSHRLEVRATDGTGEPQTDRRTTPFPDGARGYHRVDVRVS